MSHQPLETVSKAVQVTDENFWATDTTQSRLSKFGKLTYFSERDVPQLCIWKHWRFTDISQCASELLHPCPLSCSNTQTGTRSTLTPKPNHQCPDLPPPTAQVSLSPPPGLLFHLRQVVGPASLPTITLDWWALGAQDRAYFTHGLAPLKLRLTLTAHYYYYPQFTEEETT